MLIEHQQTHTSSGMDIPAWAFETIARSLLPRMQQYYESEQGQARLAELCAEQQKNGSDSPQ